MKSDDPNYRHPMGHLAPTTPPIVEGVLTEVRGHYLPNMPTPDEMPPELWMLWNLPDDDPEEDGNSGGWVISLDDPPESESYLVHFTEAEAIAGANHQNVKHDFRCVPIRVFPPSANPKEQSDSR